MAGNVRTQIPRARRLAAQTVRQLRDARGLTQEACAQRYGVGVRTLRDIEAGKARMTALELVLELSGDVAQLVEHRCPKPAVVGSSPAGPALFFANGRQKGLAPQPAPLLACTEPSVRCAELGDHRGVTVWGEADVGVAKEAA
jgi:transcriptional regulator with XRE-family HTH domain